jgi:hypothetical protein
MQLAPGSRSLGCSLLSRSIWWMRRLLIEVCCCFCEVANFLTCCCCQRPCRPMPPSIMNCMRYCAKSVTTPAAKQSSKNRRRGAIYIFSPPSRETRPVIHQNICIGWYNSNENIEKIYCSSWLNQHWPIFLSTKSPSAAVCLKATNYCCLKFGPQIMSYIWTIYIDTYWQL